ncbi:hypothetical protein [Streptomyces cirratus]|uniref:hypothetical protein n=1 Tax=Streptomyces cirratus TaxID=68187 RepID=UPI003619B503
MLRVSNARPGMGTSWSGMSQRPSVFFGQICLLMPLESYRKPMSFAASMKFFWPSRQGVRAPMSSLS